MPRSSWVSFASARDSMEAVLAAVPRKGAVCSLTADYRTCPMLLWNAELAAGDLELPQLPPWCLT